MSPDDLRKFNEAANKARAACQRAMDVLADAMRLVEEERERRLATTETKGSA